MSRYVIYARKSTESEDRQVLSIDSQIRELRNIATRQGIEIAEVLTESKSAKAPGRPIFGRLMREIHGGRIHGIVCWKMDRLARNHLDTGAVLQALADGKLDRVITIDRTYTRDGNDRFIGSFELGMATKFIDDLRQNVKRGMRAKFSQGWACYRAPVGYLNDRVTKTIVRDPDRFDLVRRMWELMLTGTMRPEQIHDLATNKWGLRTRKSQRMGGTPLARSGLYRLFSNPFYMGLLRLHDGQTFAGAHPPMVTREEFDRVHNLLGRPGRQRPQRHEFAYTGLIRCGGCGAQITAEEHVKPSGRRYVYYRCTRRKPGVVCREPAIAMPELEAQLCRVLGRLTIPAPVYSCVLERARRSVSQEHDRQVHVHSTIRKAIEGLRREEDTLLALRLRDLLTDDAFVSKRQDIQERRIHLEERLNRTAETAMTLQQSAEQAFDLARQAQHIISKGNGVQRRAVLEAIGLNYTLKARQVALELKKPFQIMANAGASSDWYSIWDDVRTWLQDTTEYFAVPDCITSVSPDSSSTAATG